MVSIYFEDDADALKIFGFITKCRKGTEVNGLIEYIPETGLVIHVSDERMGQMVEVLSYALHTFIMTSKIYNWVEQMIRSKFFYDEQEEIDQIIEITRAIIESSQTDQNGGLGLDQQVIAESLLTMLLSNVSFSFDSFAKFRLKGIAGSLMPFIEQAIDEYKMEQDYQNFIQSLREFMVSQPSKLKALHLLHDEVLYFYNDSFKKMDSGELFRQIDRRLLAENPLYIDSNTIAPLISMAPQQLFVYTDEVENGLIQTISRIFEERSVLKSKKCFALDKADFLEQLSQRNQVL
ncbi:putative sporulation protein YtxC [Peribacillus deserti]|uniref:Putative sporulation protein YtxC n=1 Tax=Peribacillus deserti TaxID=673318 RepID=A0A2N5MA39_9BACI|nr:putative sporulation protein YtxC [Peribacillus deserti]PLT31197.1 putative sporulation protein YtxC [Peribacillus deserti]